MAEPALELEAFARRVLKRPLWSHQLEAARSDRFITTIAAARRTGKTVMAETLAMHTAFSHRGCRVLILSATQDAARRLTESIGATLERSKLTRGAVVDAHATRVRLRTGSEIVSLPASQRQVRGYGEGVLLVVLDEAGFMPSELWTAAHYTALDERANGSRLLLLGTPWGGAEHFFRRAFEAGQDGDPDHASHHWTYRANPNLDRAYLERQRERVAPQEYAAEVLGEWSEASGAYFGRELLDSAVADFEPYSLAELRPRARLYLGADYGVSHDLSAVAAIARLPIGPWNPGRVEADPRPVFGVACVEVFEPGRPLTEVVAAVARSPATFDLVTTETNGVGAMPSQELLRLLSERAHAERAARRGLDDEPWAWRSVRPPVSNPHATRAASKAAGYGTLRGLLEQGRLVLPRHPELLRQLAALRHEVGDRGHQKIEAETGGAQHDDLADACMLAAGPYTEQAGGGLRVALHDAAFSVTPEAPLPPNVGEEPCVALPGGLRVPRRPWLQSPTGPELTPPPPEGGSYGDAPGDHTEHPAIASARRAVTAELNKRDPEKKWRRYVRPR